MLRIGLGYDVHLLKKGRKLILGGIEISYHKGLDGHSDADVLLHAIMDALLGAMGEPDIGHYFPSSDPSLKGIPSITMLEKVGQIVTRKGFQIQNIDSILIADKPELSKHYKRMKQKISATLQLSESSINIKGKRTEGLGFEGRGEGMAAMAIALVDRDHQT
jgi:2-C-methyl-D-erythritol 2,4-cyclodiphosphate synthase